MATNYDRMNTAQLEDEATQRGLNLEEFQALRNNEERAQRLRDHDAATQASQDQAQANAEQARQLLDQAQAQGEQTAQQQEQARQQQAQQARQDQGADQGQASDSVQVDRGNNATISTASLPQDRPADVAPYTSDRDLQNRVDAASGNVTADQPYDEADVPQVGGQNTPTVDGRDQDLNPDQK